MEQKEIESLIRIDFSVCEDIEYQQEQTSDYEEYDEYSHEYCYQ